MFLTHKRLEEIKTETRADAEREMARWDDQRRIYERLNRLEEKVYELEHTLAVLENSTPTNTGRVKDNVLDCNAPVHPF